MNKMKPIRFYQIVIVVSCIVISWGFANFALFTQHEFKALIGWGKQKNYEVVSKGAFPGDIGGEIEEDDDDKIGERIEIPRKDNTLNSINEVIQNKKQLFILITITLLIIAIVFIYVKRRKRKRGVKASSILHHPKKVKPKEKSLDINSEKASTVIHSEIRQELVKWEKGLDEHKRRKPHETMQQWLLRIKKSPNIIPIYEKVRYGEKEYSIEDLELVKCWIKQAN